MLNYTIVCQVHIHAEHIAGNKTRVFTAKLYDGRYLAIIFQNIGYGVPYMVLVKHVIFERIINNNITLAVKYFHSIC